MLFAEEVGLVLEARKPDVSGILEEFRSAGVDCISIGSALASSSQVRQALNVVHSTFFVLLGFVDRLTPTSAADITSGLQLGRAEVLQGLRKLLNSDKTEHHSIDRLKERGVEEGSG